MNNDNIIELLLTNMDLTLGEGEISELKESNNYQISIATKEDLKNCELLMRKYGQTSMTKLSPLLPRIERMVNFTFDSINYWGKLTHLETDKDGKDIYQTSFVTYVPVYSNTVIPNKQKITTYALEDRGKITGRFEYKSEKEDKYEFNLEEIKFNNFILTNTLLSLIKLNLTDDEKIKLDAFAKFEDIINISIDVENKKIKLTKGQESWEKEVETDIDKIFISNFKVTNSDMDFPDPPPIENKLIIDSNFPISGTLIALVDERTNEETTDNDDEPLQGDSSNTENNGDIIENGDTNVEDDSSDTEDEPEILESDLDSFEDVAEDTEDTDKVEPEVKEKVEKEVTIQEIDIAFSSYEEDEGKYYYRSNHDWSFHPSEGGRNLFSLEGDEVIEISESTDEGTLTKIVGRINGIEYQEKRFNGSLTVIFNENDFNDYTIDLDGTIKYVTKKTVEIDENVEENGTKVPIEIEETILELTFSSVKNYNNMLLDFSEFNFEPEGVSKENFDNYDLVDRYIIDLSSDHLRKEVERLTLGIGKPKSSKENEYDFMTNAVEFEIIPAFLSFTSWSNLDYFVSNAEYITGYAEKSSSDNKIYFYKDSNKKKEILGRPNVVYIDKHSINIEDLDKIQCYSWEPINGFSIISNDDENIDINTVD